MSTTLNLFAGSVPDVYLKSNIYDPDVDTVITGIGKVIPAVGSIVCELDASGSFTLWVVESVNQTTKKATLGPPKFVTDGTSADKLVSYGNNTLMLYFDDRQTPTRLICDSKFVVIGSNSAEYRLVATRSGLPVVISSLIDGTGNIIGDRIPIVDSGVAGIKKFSDCYTTVNLVPGELILLQIYDSAGVVTTVVRLEARRADVLNDLLSGSNPIVDFDARVDQKDGAYWVLYTGQGTNEFTVYPEIYYADGTKEVVSIDNVNGFIFGLENVDTSNTNAEYPVLVKYFIGDEPSVIAQGDTNRFLTLDRILKIKPRSSFRYSKISVVPRWESTLSRYVLDFYAYYESRDKFEILSSNDVTYVGATFNGSLYGTLQNLTIRASVIDDNGSVVSYTQSVSIQLNNDANLPYVIKDTSGSAFTYGSNTPPHVRPSIKYDNTRSIYFIPTSLFGTEASFVDNFYTQASPPYLAITETVAPAPTHFIVRDAATGQVLVADPVSTAGYAAQLAFLTNVSASDYLNKSVIVEFLKEDSGNYKILYGVVVAIGAGIYNT